ncbi:IclR family transcriptional regulator domain-containing protein [Haladaptatus litoreus]|uniref:IclR family transcriptional regulator domain-containing protein n=1 Tax=Haladaptatus litoreus TaxID=553468 RepID=UPI0009712E48
MREALIEALEFTKHTEHTISNRDQLREELIQVRDQGMAFNREETTAGLAGTGAPVRTQKECVYGAVSIIGPTSQMTGDRLDEVSEMIHHTVNVIEINATSI